MEICESIILTYFFWKYIGNMEHISIIFPSYFQWKYEAAHPVWNCLPTAPLKGTTPYEAWYKQKPDFSMFTVFGCTAYVFVQKDKRKSLQPHMEKCIFIGYPSGYKGWRFYNLTTKKFIIAETAQFDERYFPGLSKSISPISTTPIVSSPPQPSIVQLPLPAEEMGEHPVQNSLPNRTNEDEALSQPNSPPQPIAPQLPLDLPNRSPSPSPPPSPPPEAPPRVPTPPLAQRCPRREIHRPAPYWLYNPLTNPNPNANWHVREPTPVISDSDDDEEAGYRVLELAGVAASDPRTYKEAMSGPMASQWQTAAETEFLTLVANGTWELVDLPPGAKALRSGWVFKVKTNAVLNSGS